MKGIIGKEIADSLQVPLSSLADLLIYSYTFYSLISFILKSTSFPAKKQLDRLLPIVLVKKSIKCLKQCLFFAKKC